MGGPAGGGGSDRSDEKKVDTYSNQLKKIQKKKSKTERNEFGYTVPKKNSFVPPSVAIIKGVFGNTIDKVNLNKRMKFANKTGVQIQGLSTEEILSKDFKAKLDAKGYTRKDPRTGSNQGGDNQKSVEQPKVKSQMNNTDVKSDLITAKAPAITEMTADEIALKNKRKGRKKTILTSVTGVDDYPTLSKKTLLG